MSSALTLLLLTSCASSPEYVAPQMPAAPADLTRCTAETVPDIPGAPGTGLDKAQSSQALAEQRAAAKAKDRCSRSWADFYEDLRKSIGGAK